MSVIPSSAKAGDSALEALVDAAAGILSADSLQGTLGRIAHHLAMLVPFDDLSLYEIEEGGDSLKPVFAVGDWVDEIMAEEISVANGVTGWVVRNRRTRNVPNTLLEPLCTVVSGTDEVAEAFVAVPLIAHGRVVGSLNVYRTGADVPFTDTEVELVERFATMAALAYDSARQRDLLREEVRTDSLTGLLNHRGSQERLRTALDDAGGRAGGRVSVVVIDLDHFKRINDTFGHAEGDRALALAAAALRDVVRESDAVGRLGGEEFVLVLPGVDAAAAREAAERARIAISEVQIGGRQLACSAGLACHPDDAGDAPGLLMAADAALYAAKDTGRGRTCRYRPSLALRPSPGEEREEIEAILRGGEALLSAAFQPVLELATGRVSGFEALARFHVEPPRGPDEWFAQAHRVGLGAELEAAALRAALAVPDRPAGTFLSLNVSPRALAQPLVQAELPADLSTIVIELTEHELFGAEDELAARLAELRARGARIALDDAGAGYAGLQQLIAVAPDILKLDRSLVHGANADPAKLALLEAMISFASSTGAAVCGEGVEDLDDLRALADLDATYAQGYALARPAPPWPLLTPGAAAHRRRPPRDGRARRRPPRRRRLVAEPRRARHAPRRRRRRPRARHRRPHGRRPAGRRRRVADDRLQGARADRRAPLRASGQPARRAVVAGRLPRHRAPRRHGPDRPGRGRRPARRPGRAGRARAPADRRDADGPRRAGPRPPGADGGLPRPPAGLLAGADRARPRRRAAARRRDRAAHHPLRTGCAPGPPRCRSGPRRPSPPCC